MSTRVESESYNPLAEFFEQEDQEDEVRRRRRAIGPRYRNRFNSANRNIGFLQPSIFPRQFIRPLPRPRLRLPFPFPSPFPWPQPVEPPMQPATQGTPPPNFGSSGGAAPVSDGWDPQGALVEPTGQASPDGNGQAGMDPGDGDTAQPTGVQQTGGDEEFFEFGAYEHESPGTITLPPIVICGGTPFATLDNFSFGKSTLRDDDTRKHPAQVKAIADEIKNRAARRRPVPTVCIVGRTDLVGAQNYNYTLGLERAQAVKKALCTSLGAYAYNMTFVLSSLGEMDPTPTGASVAARARNRRVDVHLLSERTDGERCTGTGEQPPNYPDRCGVPRRNARRGLNTVPELEEFEQMGTSRRVRVRPKLCLHLNAPIAHERNHFEHQAIYTARRISAIGSPNASNCRPRVGATPFANGADIINAIRAAWECTGKQPIESVHIFGHSGHRGISGNTEKDAGLYRNSFTIDAASRSEGGRHISEIPTSVLSNNVVFVLHGCRQAEGCGVKGTDANFAQSLFQHLSATLTNPKVYGHYNVGCAGRNNSWCLYAKSSPTGKAHARPDYVEPPRSCDKPGRELEMESEQEKGKCETIERFTIDDYGRGVSQLTTAQQGKINTIRSAIRKRAHNCGGISIVEIRGHASTEGPAGRNRDLAQVRADVVKGALSTMLRGARVFATTKGETLPLVTPDNTDQKQRQNRRVEIFVM